MDIDLIRDFLKYYIIKIICVFKMNPNAQFRGANNAFNNS